MIFGLVYVIKNFYSIVMLKYMNGMWNWPTIVEVTANLTHQLGNL